MKRTLKVIVLAIFLIAIATTTVKATASEDLLKELTKTYVIGGEEYTMEETDRVKIERYLKDHPVTEEQKNILLEKFHAIIDIMNEENVPYPALLSKEKRDEAIKLAEEGAKAINLKFVADTIPNTITIYNMDGKLIEKAEIRQRKLIYTGSNSYMYIVAPTVAVIAIATVAICKKKANA